MRLPLLKAMRGRWILVPILLLAVGGVGALAVRLVQRIQGESAQRGAEEPEEQPPRVFEARFPAVALIPGLLDAPQPAREPFTTLYFGTGPDGTEGLWRDTRDDTWRALDESLNVLREVPVPPDPPVDDWVRAPDGVLYYLSSRKADDPRNDDLWSVEFGVWQGGVRWSRTYEFGFEAHAWLYRDGVVAGVLLAPGGKASEGQREDLVAFDLEGRPLWTMSDKFVIYDVLTHHELPGWVLCVGGDVTLLSEASAPSQPRPVLGGSRYEERVYAGTYVTHGQLFPAPDGQPRLVLAGSGVSRPPVLLSMDPQGHIRWRARPPGEVEEMAMIEAPGKPRLFALTTDAGELLIVGEEGTLHARVSMPGADPGRRNYRSVSVGEFRPGVWGIVVDGARRTDVYRLHLDKFP